MSVVLSEHLALLASAPDGIQKVRGLILELAVRGKLVPQDPKDEPASELLKRIAQERARLESEGVCKKSKATPPMGKDERPFDVPEGWKWCRFPEVAYYKMGKTPPTKEAAYWADNGIPWVSISDMNPGQTIATTARTVSNVALERVFRSAPVPAGTLLMSFKLTVGKVATLGVDAFHNEAIISIFPFEGVSQEFMSHLLPMIAQGGNSKSALMGDTLNSESLALLAIPLPPVAEQHRIVAKVDELMALCDRLEAEQTDAESAHARLVETLLGTLTQSTGAAELAANWQRLADHFDTLFTTESSLDALKQTVLQLAVMGKLVPQDPDDEPASELLKRVAKERARLEANGACKKLLATPLLSDDVLPFDAPEQWKWCRLDELLAISGGVTLGRKLAGRTMVSRPYLRVANVQRGKLLLDHIKSIEVPADEKDKYQLQMGDLLITEGGDWDKVGRTAIWHGEIPECLHQNHVFRARPLSAEWHVRWTEMYLNAAPARAYFAASSKQTTNLASINMTQLKSCPFPVPPLAEQHRIVAKVDGLIALCDRLKTDLAESRTRQARLSSTLIESALQAA